MKSQENRMIEKIAVWMMYIGCMLLFGGFMLLFMDV